MSRTWGWQRPFEWLLEYKGDAGAEFNDTESLESWLARRERQKKLGRNGNGMGMPLAIAVRLLPTPTAVTTWRSPAGHMAWRHGNGRTQPCDLQVAVVLQVAPPDPGEPGAAPPGQAGGPAGRLLPTPDTGTSRPGTAGGEAAPATATKAARTWTRSPGHCTRRRRRAPGRRPDRAGTRASRTGSRPGPATRAWTGDRMRPRSAAGSMPSAAPRLLRQNACQASGCS